MLTNSRNHFTIITGKIFLLPNYLFMSKQISGIPIITVWILIYLKAIHLFLKYSAKKNKMEIEFR